MPEKVTWTLIATMLPTIPPIIPKSCHQFHHLRVIALGVFLGSTLAAWGQNNLDFTWTWRNPRPHAEYIESAVWTGERIVASGIHGSALTSVDDQTWLIHDASGCTDRDQTLYSLTWTGRQIFGLTWQGKVCKSADGLRWEVADGDTLPRRAMVWAQNQLVAVGDGGLIATSPDGKTWTKQISGTANPLSAILWTGDTLVVGGDGNGLVLTSTNAINWKAQTLAMPIAVRQVAHHSGVLLVCGPLANQFGEAYCFSRPDGKTWSEEPYLSGDWRRLIAFKGSFVATGTNNDAYASKDGVNWEVFPIDTVTPARPTQLLVVEDRLLAFTWPGPSYQSWDGKKWSRLGSGYLGQLRSVAKGQGHYVAVGDDGIVMTSINAVQWTQVATSIRSRLNRIIWARDRYYAVGENGSVFTSVNGREWQEKPTGYAEPLYALVWSGKEFVAVGRAAASESAPSMASSLILTSGDGESWVRRSVAAQSDLVDIAWSGSRFLAAGSRTLSQIDQVVTSTDGENWSVQTTPFNQPSSVQWGNGQFLITHGSGLIRLSSDGTQWTDTLLPIATRSATWTGTHWVAGFESHQYFLSSDGKQWQERRNPTSVNFYQLIWTGEQLLGVGAYGCIFTAIPFVAAIQTQPGKRRMPRIQPGGWVSGPRSILTLNGFQFDGLGRLRNAHGMKGPRIKAQPVF